MVRSSGSYRKASQRGPRGGKTRQERVRDKINRERRRLRENGLVRVKFTSLSGAPDHRETARYGIYKDGSEWVLTGLMALHYTERTTPGRGTNGYSETVTQWKGALLGRRDGLPNPTQGIEIDRFDTKNDALCYVSADGSTRVEAGRYLVQDEHDPRRRREEVDKEAYRAFSRRAKTIH